MSLWGATVITSLASALPIVGTSIVGWLWGAFSVNWRLNHIKTSLFMFDLENSDYCGNNFFMESYSLLKEFSLFLNMIRPVKMLSIHSQFADAKTDYTVVASQRLNAEEHAWLVGFYEADGWFGVFKNGKYLQYEFGIQLHKRDIILLRQIQNMYKLSGVVKNRKDRPDMVVFKVRNKKDLITKIVPIFDTYQMIGPKIQQYQFFRFHLVEHRTKLSQDLNTTKCQYSYKENTVFEMINTSYFDSWLVGFINGEGCFSVYKPKNSKSNVCSFDIAQKNGGFLLLSAIRDRLKFMTKVYKDFTGCYRLKISSVSNCASLLKFLCSHKVKLKGHKSIQFIQWAKELRVNPRYISICVPNKFSLYIKPT